MATHQLIGAEVSYYTGKVRAYLRYKDIPFDEVLATREVYKNVIVPRTDVRFIPVLISDDDVAIQDSTAIIDFLEQRYPDPSVYPATPLQRLVALLLEVYGDEWLVIPAMHYRWSFPENREFALHEFGKVSEPAATPEQQRALGEQLSKPFAGALPPLGVTPEMAPAIEASYLAFLEEFEAHLGEQPFLLGTRPSIGDFALFGPLYAHLYRDPYSGRLMKARAPRVADWVERMNAPQPRSGGFLPGDAIPRTLIPILQRMFREQGPVLANTIRHLSAWAEHNDGPEVPRVIGMHEYRIGEAKGQRAVFPFNLWRWQRPHDLYQQLQGGERAQADLLLESAGGRSLINLPVKPRLRRERNRLMLD